MSLSQALNSEPLEVTIQKRGTLRYLPISTIEATLDRLFGWDGWELKDFKTLAIANEITGEITLCVWSEKRNQWIQRIGAGAVQIMLDKITDAERQQGKRRRADDIHAKKLNALEMAYPHLLSDCVKNACKRLGKVFGRDVSRKKEHVEIFSTMEQDKRWLDLLDKAMEVETLDQWAAAKEGIPYQFLANPEFNKVNIETLNRLSQNQLSERVDANDLFGGKV